MRPGNLVAGSAECLDPLALAENLAYPSYINSCIADGIHELIRSASLTTDQETSGADKTEWIEPEQTTDLPRLLQDGNPVGVDQDFTIPGGAQLLQRGGQAAFRHVVHPGNFPVIRRHLRF